MDGAYACVDGFLDGFGGGLEWFLDDLGLILMDFGCSWDGVWLVFDGFAGILDERWMDL